MNNKRLKKYLQNKTRNKRTYFWGASLFLREILKNINLKSCKINGIIDINPDKSGKIFQGYKIFNASDIEKLNPEIIIVSATNYPALEEEIEKILEEKNINCKVFSLAKIMEINNIKFNLMKFNKKSNAQKLKYIIETANNYVIYDSKIKGMLCPEEKQMLHLLAKYYYKEHGAIFDAGIFLGGCTEALCNGLSKNRRIRPNHQIWVYEYGHLGSEENYKNSYTYSFLKDSYPDREITSNFIELTLENLNSLNKSNCYRLHIGDINQQPYPEKIEIMFLDVCKSQETNFSMQKLFSRLIPGKSIVIQQDYIFEGCPWLRVTMGYLKDYFEFIGCTKINSAVFLLKKQIPYEVLNINPYVTFNYSELEEMHNYYNKYLTQEQEKLVLQALDIMKKDTCVEV